MPVNKRLNKCTLAIVTQEISPHRNECTTEPLNVMGKLKEVILIERRWTEKNR